MSKPGDAVFTRSQRLSNVLLFGALCLACCATSVVFFLAFAHTHHVAQLIIGLVGIALAASSARVAYRVYRYKVGDTQ